MSDRREQIIQNTITQILDLVFHALEAHHAWMTVLEGTDRVRQEIFLSQAQAAFDQFYSVKEEITTRRELAHYQSQALIRQSSTAALSLISKKAAPSGVVECIFRWIQRCWPFNKYNKLD